MAVDNVESGENFCAIIIKKEVKLEKQKKHLSPYISWSFVALAAGICLFTLWYYDTQVSTAYENAVPSFIGVRLKPKATNSAHAKAQLTYNNPIYNFTLTFPSTWTGYKFKGVQLAGLRITYYIEVPTTDKTAIGDTYIDAGYYSPFAISVYTPQEWAQAATEEGPRDTLLIQGANYVFAYSKANGTPPPDFNMSSDIDTIIKSFKLN